MRVRPGALMLLAASLAAFVVSGGGCGSAVPQAHRPPVSVTVGSRPTGQPLPPGFVGLSLEYPALEAYANPAAIRLIRRLDPGQRPVLRIGGNSTDETWWPQPKEPAPRGATFRLTERWLRTAHLFAAVFHARMILGLNLAAREPAVARDEARAFLRGIGARYVESFEIGNEPDLYGLFPWPQGPHTLRRAASYSLSDYIREFSRWRAAIGSGLPAAGPAYATFDWSLGRFIQSEPGLKLVTVHHYPLDACLTKRWARGYPTITSLLSDQSSDGLARQLIPSLAAAHARHVPFRLDELNSASCGGKPGVSNTFASALWMLDTLFDLAKIGVDGVNVHTFPGAVYAPFAPDGRANPEYYGMLMFTRAFPRGARLLPAKVTPAAPLKAWATQDATRAIRVVLINKDLHRAYRVALHALGLTGAVDLEWLRGGQRSATAAAINVPADDAVLVTQ